MLSTIQEFISGFGFFTYAIAAAAFFGFPVVIAFFLRTVVPTNEVHIVQSSKSTTSYGKDTNNGNVYYCWPSFMPFIGINKIVLPTSIFDLDLKGYEAYDVDRLPFIVDVKAFFRISDSNLAAQRVAGFDELMNQLNATIQSALRSMFTGSTIHQIMEGRAKFGTEFTHHVDADLANWGVQTVKNIELMHIVDGKDSKVIENIMNKKKSHIEMESRIEVAQNKKLAEMAEIEARKEVSIQTQQTNQQIGIRTVEAERAVEIQKQIKSQEIKEQEKVTAEKQMAVARVQETRRAEIDKEVQILRANQARDTVVIAADAELEAQKKSAEAVALNGKAHAEAEQASLMAPVNAQMALAKEIGTNEKYQMYLVSVKEIEAKKEIGIAQAAALEKAEVKIIANTGKPTEGVTKVMDLFSSAGGTELGAMFEGLKQTPTGKKMVEKYLT